ncbi:MAG: putative zinc-binding peptidase [Verrucomicrobia bacterium]|nr:putative zinc-binding peptidase [Verrucomicrobiota bacterium]
MKSFYCDVCGWLVHFENTQCLNCGSALAYLPETGQIGSVRADVAGNWQSASGVEYRLCRNYAEYNVCNWALPADESNVYCVSCRLNQMIPNLSIPGNQAAWARFESAKRRLNYTLLNLGLPVTGKAEDPTGGVSYHFKADQPDLPVITGHEDGVITINLAEADDAERERRRLALGEPYRTILGHFRHEIGHYYWDRFFRDEPSRQGFRTEFGDERADYAQALKIYYENGAPKAWEQEFISAYATSHPWEDWAETWAHYLHMIDVLETAASARVSLAPQASKPALTITAIGSFEQMAESWLPLTYLLNNLNRSLGFQDAYPFVLSPVAIKKLRFVHHTIRAFVANSPSSPAE